MVTAERGAKGGPSGCEGLGARWWVLGDVIPRGAAVSGSGRSHSTPGWRTGKGPVGFVVGPIIAALFVTTWQIYGEVFQDWLPVRPKAILTDADGQPTREAPTDDAPDLGAAAT